MNRRQLLRQSLLGAAAATAFAPAGAGARELPPNSDASKELARADWKPKLLDEHQNETLIVFSDRMIPATDTPGAKEALVNRFLDELMAAESSDRQREFLSALAALDTASMSQYKTAFIQLTAEQQNDLLHYLAYPHSLETWGETPREQDPGHHQFMFLKSWVSRAYYNSEIGMRELGWDGGPPHGQYTGCATTQTDARHKETAHR